MKKTLISLLLVAALMLGITGSAFAAGPAEYTIDVRNRTGQSVEFNYTGADGILHTTSIPAGTSKLTLLEGTYNYWAAPKCGSVAGTFNVSQQRQTLWIDCDDSTPSVDVASPQGKAGPGVVFFRCLNGGSGAYEYNFYDWGDGDWGIFGTFCYDSVPTEGYGEWANIWEDGENYWYLYMPTGINDSGYGNCDGWSDFGEGFYYLGFTDVNDYWLDCPEID